MAEKNTRSILETIKKKITKLDQKSDKVSNFSEIGEEFEYIHPSKKSDNHSDEAEKLDVATQDNHDIYSENKTEYTKAAMPSFSDDLSFNLSPKTDYPVTQEQRDPLLSSASVANSVSSPAIPNIDDLNLEDLHLDDMPNTPSTSQTQSVVVPPSVDQDKSVNQNNDIDAEMMALQQEKIEEQKIPEVSKQELPILDEQHEENHLEVSDVNSAAAQEKIAVQDSISSQHDELPELDDISLDNYSAAESQNNNLAKAEEPEIPNLDELSLDELEIDSTEEKNADLQLPKIEELHHDELKHDEEDHDLNFNDLDHEEDHHHLPPITPDQKVPELDLKELEQEVENKKHEDSLSAPMNHDEIDMEFEKELMGIKPEEKTLEEKKPQGQQNVVIMSNNSASRDDSKILSEATLMKSSESIKKLIDAKNIVSGINSFAQSNETLQELAIHLLEPKLEKWMNENLPELVEKIVQEEIKKIIPKL